MYVFVFKHGISESLRYAVANIPLLSGSPVASGLSVVIIIVVIMIIVLLLLLIIIIIVTLI